jgi:hypothetical protein
MPARRGSKTSSLHIRRPAASANDRMSPHSNALERLTAGWNGLPSQPVVAPAKQLTRSVWMLFIALRREVQLTAERVVWSRSAWDCAYRYLTST